MRQRSSAKLAVLPRPDVDPWPALFQSFARGLRAADASKRTIEIYDDGQRLFHGWAVERKLPTDPKEITKAEIEDFLIWLRETRGAKPATVRARFSCLRRFFRWLIEEGELEHSPMEHMHSIKVEETAPDVLTDDELRRLLDACKGDALEDRRDMAIIRLMVDSGMRRKEVAGIKVEDVDLESQTIRITRKGGRQQVVPYGVKAARDLDRYLRLRDRSPHRDVAALWLSGDHGLSGDGLHNVIKRRARLAGIERRVWPHLLRHSFADRLKNVDGLADEVVMTLGGWSDPKSMRRYGASRRQARALEAHRRHSPGDRI